MRTVEMHEVNGAPLLVARGLEVTDLENEPVVIKKTGSDLSGDSGVLIPIGGAATDENLRFVTQFAREDTGITIVTAPTQKPDETFEELDERFRTVNHQEEIYHLRFDTSRDEARKMLERSSVVYISGGSQKRAMEILEAEGIDDEIKRFYLNNNTVAGSSAGASLMGMSSPYGKDMMKGLGLTPLTIDQHTGERGREWRVKKAANKTKRSAIGFNEGTGGIIRRDTAEIQIFGSTGAYVAWRPNGHEETTGIPTGYSVELPIVTGQYATPKNNQALHPAA
jgi:cyanophycinase